ncbi:MAG: MMPL family transporter [Luteitalea sp.]|nr:MMPL family transporter [Luteitalea sp.]
MIANRREVIADGADRPLSNVTMTGIFSIPALIAWARGHRRLVLIGTCVLLLVSVVGVSRVRFDANVLHLLPREGAAVPAFETYLERFGSLDQLYIVFTAPPDHTIDEYDSVIDRFVARLGKAPEIDHIDTGRIDTTRDWSYLADHLLWLLDEQRLHAALARFEPEEMREALDASRRLLTLPSPAVTTMVSQDPLGLFNLLSAQLGGGSAGVGLGASSSGYVAPDGQSRLVIARPSSPPFDTAFSHRLFERLNDIERAVTHDMGLERNTPNEESRDVISDPFADALPPLDVAYAGGHRIGIETEAQIKRESIVNSIGSLVLILPALLLIFRSPWLLACGAIPTGLSLLVVLGALGFAGTTLSAAATGASAMLFGLGIDGVVLLYVTYRLGLSDGLPSHEAVRRTSGASASMLLGMWTTAATFYGLVVIDYPSLQQLGMLIGHSMVVCGILTLLLVPAMLPSRPGTRPPRALTLPGLAALIGRQSRLVLIAAALVTVALAVAALGLQVNPTLERLESTTPAVQFEQAVARRFGLPTDVGVVLARGRELQTLVDGNAKLADAIHRELPGLPIHTVSALLPSSRQQAVTRQRLRQEGLSPDVAGRRIHQVATDVGFRTDTLAPFVARLPRLLDRAQRVSYQGYVDHGLGDVISRFVSREGGGWVLASYVLPRDAKDIARVDALVRRVAPDQQLTGLPLVNAELAARFLPEFLKGLGVGTAIVLALILATFREWRLSLLALAPTALGLVWTAGVLALAGVELDLFAVFAVVTFVGIGVDYGIHLVHRYRQYGYHAERATSELAPVILVAGLITLLGYGTLINSSYPPLQSIGVVSAVSVLALVAASVLVLPAMLERVGATCARKP